MRDVAVISFSQQAHTCRDLATSETDLLVPVITDALARAGLDRHEVGFTISGSSDFVVGRPFSFVMALDAVGAWPPISESHVEMDGAFALYEAYTRLQHGDVDSALVYAFGKPSLGPLRDVLALQTDPYCVAPLWPDSVALAALQARAMLDRGVCTERELAEVVARRRAAAVSNPHAFLREAPSARELADAPFDVAPLRAHDAAPIVDGAAAIVLAAGDLARRLSSRPAWIRGIDHRVETQALGARDLASSPSTRLAAERAGALGRRLDVAELDAPFSHQDVLLARTLELAASVDVNPSGGPLAGYPFMVSGLTRIGEVASRILDGRATSGLAHATSGPCLQQNLVCVMEAG